MCELGLGTLHRASLPGLQRAASEGWKPCGLSVRAKAPESQRGPSAALGQFTLDRLAPETPRQTSAAACLSRAHTFFTPLDSTLGSAFSDLGPT